MFWNTLIVCAYGRPVNTRPNHSARSIKNTSRILTVTPKELFSGSAAQSWHNIAVAGKIEE
jgi:hypothetical protein